MPRAFLSSLPDVPPRDRPLDLAAVRAGDPDALADCYRAHASALLAVAYRLTASRADAEDVVHDVFVGLPEALARYEERGQFGAWLARITTRVALATQRRDARFDDESALDQLGAVGVVEGDVLATDWVHGALAALTPPLRHVFVLRVVHEYTHAEIAALLGITPNASEVRLHRAVQQLRRLLGSRS